MNVSLWRVVAPAGAWPAELVGYCAAGYAAKAGTNTSAREPGNRSRHVVGRRRTPRRGNAHRTEVVEEREVLYPGHPWLGALFVP